MKVFRSHRWPLPRAQWVREARDLSRLADRLVRAFGRGAQAVQLTEELEHLLEHSVELALSIRAVVPRTRTLHAAAVGVHLAAMDTTEADELADGVDVLAETLADLDTALGLVAPAASPSTRTGAAA